MLVTFCQELNVMLASVQGLDGTGVQPKHTQTQAPAWIYIIQLM